MYLWTATGILEELIKSWNPRILDWKDIGNYENITKRSDFNISIPTLFLFFHWLEIIIKWLIIKLWNNAKKNHKLSESLNELATNLKNSNPKLINTLEKYIYKENSNQILKELLNLNNEENSDWFFEFLKYPFNKKEVKKYSYIPIRYKQKEFLSFAKELIEDTNIIREESIKIYREEKDI